MARERTPMCKSREILRQILSLQLSYELVRRSLCETKEARVHIDYHVAFEGHFYSVPYTLQGEPVLVRATGTTVEILHKHKRVAAHVRSPHRGRHTTVTEHMPKAHQRHAGCSPGDLLNWAATVGPHTASLCRAILEERRHPEQGYRSGLGLIRLGRRYDKARIEAACEVLEDRHERRATIVASQLPVERWHAWLQEPTVADAILDRLVHRSYRLVLKGGSPYAQVPRDPRSIDLAFAGHALRLNFQAQTRELR